MKYLQASEINYWSSNFHVSIADLLPIWSFWKAGKITTSEYLQMVGGLRGPCWYDREGKALMYFEHQHVFVYTATDNLEQPILESVRTTSLSEPRRLSLKQIYKESNFVDEGHLNSYGLPVDHCTLEVSGEAWTYTYKECDRVMHAIQYVPELVEIKHSIPLKKGTVIDQSRRGVKLFTVTEKVEDGRAMIECVHGNQTGYLVVINSEGLPVRMENPQAITEYHYYGDGVMSHAVTSIKNSFFEPKSVVYSWIKKEGEDRFSSLETYLEGRLISNKEIPQH